MRLDHYRAIDHEADTGFEIYGKTLQELYQNGAEALFSLIVDHGKATPEKGKRLDLKDDNGLLVVFLNELLYFWDTEGFIPKEFSLKIDRGKLTGTVLGTIYDPRRDKMKQEVKAVTYHQFSTEEKQGLYKARVIVDV
jgi:SHS2 domain-containing protein